MKVRVVYGDVFDYSGDVLVCPANSQLNMSGGVNGEILRRGGNAIQAELWEHLKRIGKVHVPPETVVATSPGPLPFQRFIHAVAIDAFYETSRERVARTIFAAWRLADELGLLKVVMTAVGTGYGRLPVGELGGAVCDAVSRCEKVGLDVTLVMRDAEDADLLDRLARPFRA